MAEEKERTVEEKYELAKMVLMLIERASLAHMMGMLPPEKLMHSMVMIANMGHVANHENGEETFDCGDKRVEHHSQAIAEYFDMYSTMLEDIKKGNDVTQLAGKGGPLSTGASNVPKGKELNLDKADLSKPLDFS